MAKTTKTSSISFLIKYNNNGGYYFDNPSSGCREYFGHTQEALMQAKAAVKAVRSHKVRRLRLKSIETHRINDISFNHEGLTLNVQSIKPAQLQTLVLSNESATVLLNGLLAMARSYGSFEAQIGK
jgi:hypothetical protein